MDDVCLYCCSGAPGTALCHHCLDVRLPQLRPLLRVSEYLGMLQPLALLHRPFTVLQHGTCLIEVPFSNAGFHVCGLEEDSGSSRPTNCP